MLSRSSKDAKEIVCTLSHTHDEEEILIFNVIFFLVFLCWRNASSKSCLSPCQRHQRAPCCIRDFAGILLLCRWMLPYFYCRWKPFNAIGVLVQLHAECCVYKAKYVWWWFNLPHFSNRLDFPFNSAEHFLYNEAFCALSSSFSSTYLVFLLPSARGGWKCLRCMMKLKALKAWGMELQKGKRWDRFYWIFYFVNFIHLKIAIHQKHGCHSFVNTWTLRGRAGGG